MDPIWGPGNTTRVFPPKNFYSAQLHMKIQLAAKFQKKTDGRLSGNSPDRRTDGRTDGTDYYSPFPTKVGGLKRLKSGLVSVKIEVSVSVSVQAKFSNNFFSFCFCFSFTSTLT